MDLQRLIQEAHANSVKHGFWGLWRKCQAGGCTKEHRVCLLCNVTIRNTDWSRCSSCSAIDDPAQRDIPTKIALIHSELSEALEEFRNNKMPAALAWLYYDVCALPNYAHRTPLDKKCNEPEAMCCRDDDRPHKPVGFMSELADVAIRLFDLAGWLGLTLEDGKQYDQLWKVVDTETVPGTISRLHHCVSQMGRDLLGYGGVDGGSKLQARWLLLGTEQLAQRVGGDLQSAIEIKMAYNATRPMMHGGKVV